MRNTRIHVLDSYSDAFRDLINDKVWGTDGEIRQRLRLNSARDWAFVCSSMDIVGDASQAIRNFLQFGLDGPTRYRDAGEAYLRLYGVLSAAYVQQESINKLCKLMNIPDFTKIEEQVRQLEIRDLRHRLASHGTDYRSARGRDSETFVPVRVSLAGLRCQYFDNLRMVQTEVDLGQAIDTHLLLMISILDGLLDKSVLTLFRGHQKKLSEYRSKLDDLRVEKGGGFVARSGDGKVLLRVIMHES